MYFHRYTYANKYEKYAQTHHFQGNTNQNKKHYLHLPIQIFNELTILKNSTKVLSFISCGVSTTCLVQLLGGH